MKSKTPLIIRLSVDADVTAILNCLAEAFAPYKANYTAEAFLVQCFPLKPLSIA